MRTLVNGAGRSRVSAVSPAPWSAQNYVSAFTTAAAQRARSSAPGQVARRRIDRCDGSAWTVGRRLLMVAVGPPPDRAEPGRVTAGELGPSAAGSGQSGRRRSSLFSGAAGAERRTSPESTGAEIVCSH